MSCLPHSFAALSSTTMTCWQQCSSRLHGSHAVLRTFSAVTASPLQPRPDAGSWRWMPSVVRFQQPQSILTETGTRLQRFARTLFEPLTQSRALAKRSSHPTNRPSRPSLSNIRPRNLSRPHTFGLKPPPPPPPPGLSSLINSFFSRIPPHYVIRALIAANVIVFMAWNYAKMSADKHQDYRLAHFMVNNFLCGWDSLWAGRWWTLFTCTISQADFFHFLFNTIGLSGVAGPLASAIGTPATLALYFGCGLSSATGFLMWARYGSPWLEKRRAATRAGNAAQGTVPPIHRRSHGASGALFGFISCTACIAPRASFVLYNIVPVPAWAFVPGMLAFEMYRTLTDSGGSTDTVGRKYAWR